MISSTSLASPTFPTKIKEAGPPFDDTNADIILRAADGVDFRVIRAFLTTASQGFRDMFAAQSLLPTTNRTDGTVNSDDVKDGLPIVRLEEADYILRPLLELIYPMDNPILKDVHQIRLLIRALDKYVVEGFMKTREEMLKGVLKEKPHLVYAIACRFNMHKIADQAAVETLRSPMMLTSGPLQDSGLQQMTSVQLRKLLYYHYISVEAATSELRYWLPETRTEPQSSYPCNDSSPPSTSCQAVKCICERQTVAAQATKSARSKNSNSERAFTVPSWVINFLKTCEVKLKEKPHWRTLDDRFDAAHWEWQLSEDELLRPYLQEAARCGMCGWKAKVEMPALRRTLAVRVRTRIWQVRLLGFLYIVFDFSLITSLLGSHTIWNQDYLLILCTFTLIKPIPDIGFCP